MSEQDTREAIELPNHGDLAFGALMDALAPEGEAEKAAGADRAEGAGAVRPAAGDTDTGAGGGDRQPPAPAGAEADGGGAGEAGRPAPASDADAGGADQKIGESAQGADGGGAEQPATIGEGPASWTVDPTKVAPELGELSTRIEENLVNGYRNAAYEDTRKEHARYFEALEVHPRMLIGKQVPSMSGEGMETLRDTNDAREWQEAVKAVLVQEIEARTHTWMQDAYGFMETIHSSIDLFKNNPDLIPGTKGFDKELADDLAGMMKPYEVRIEGKLHGYSIPVQPIIDNLRLRKKPTASQTKAAPKAEAATPEPPQRGISSKAATSGEPEDFSTLFGTIGLPQLRI